MSKKKVLVCDDDTGILEMLELALESDETVIITESNSLNVIPLIEKEKPDLILLDLWMPVLSGDQILRAIRQQTDTQSLPVIIISASLDGAKIARENGANDFLAKPFDIDELFNRVCKQIEVGC
ncbi:response regulator [Mucilaginibacter sp. RS28]|uniref:Response regulator n=1 Tax=Mucilaginibacter straminoryzae TaxID=2932774 RepID=A0A9X2BCF4_9SPHI|nr:response regulator [Mucilaginibacter straminoryzae]MCJ8209253.1 response regulator [Mucilaginibacter straminoryzae]